MTAMPRAYRNEGPSILPGPGSGHGRGPPTDAPGPPTDAPGPPTDAPGVLLGRRPSKNGESEGPTPTIFGCSARVMAAHPYRSGQGTAGPRATLEKPWRRAGAAF